MRTKREKWCGEGDLNPHEVALASPSSWCVCQFRHLRTLEGTYRPDYIKSLEGAEQPRKEHQLCPARLAQTLHALRWRRAPVLLATGAGITATAAGWAPRASAPLLSLAGSVVSAWLPFSSTEPGPARPVAKMASVIDVSMKMMAQTVVAWERTSGRAPRPKSSLAAHAAEGTSQVGRLAALQQHPPGSAPGKPPRE